MSSTDNEIPLNLADDFPEATYQQWRDAAEKLLKGAPFDKVLLTKTYEDIILQPIYHRADVEGLPHLQNLPATAPFLRGTESGGYLTRPWQIAQEIPALTPQEYNLALRHDLDYGQNTVVLKPDGVICTGQDELDPAPRYRGLPLRTLTDLMSSFKDVEVGKHPLVVHAGALGLPLTAMLVEWSQQKNINPADTHAWINADPLGVLLETGRLPLPAAEALDQQAVLSRWARQHAPGWQVFGINAHKFHNAGASAVHEVAFALAQGLCYLREMEQRGIEPENVVGQMRFSVGLGPFFFMEIAKIRAARMLWAEISADCGIAESACKLHLHGVGSTWHLTRLDPYVNMLRGATEAFSGVMAGCDSLEILPFDAAIRMPDEFSRRIARNTQIILKEECHFDRVIDPAGGAWYVEKLTAEVAEKAWALFRQVEGQGGFLAAIQSGWLQEEIGKTARKRRDSLALRQDKMVGVNMYPNLKEKKLEQSPQNYKQAVKQVNESQIKQKKSRDDAALHRALDAIAQSRGDALLPQLSEAFRTGATLGEVLMALRHSEQGESVTALPPHRAAETYEALRETMEAHVAVAAVHPRVYLANLGTSSQFRARAEFSRGFFEIAGFLVQDGEPLADPIVAAEAAAQSGAEIVTICSSDDLYPQVVPDFARQLKEKSPQTILVLAGYPREHVEQFRQAGVDEFIHIRANVQQLLSDLMRKVGVKL